MAKDMVNPHCPVKRCAANQPHAADKHVAALMTQVSEPHLMVGLVHDALAELGNAACNELANKQFLAFTSRLRQIEELYIRTLYLLLLATPEEQPHIVAGAIPNGLSRYYRAVNPSVFSDQLDWEKVMPGLNGDSFTIMDTLHGGAHTSYFAIMMARGLAANPSQLISVERYAEYIKGKLTKLRYMHGMFKAGKSREDVLGGVTALHRPSSYWEAQIAELKAGGAPL